MSEREREEGQQDFADRQREASEFHSGPADHDSDHILHDIGHRVSHTNRTDRQGHDGTPPSYRHFSGEASKLDNEPTEVAYLRQWPHRSRAPRR